MLIAVEEDGELAAGVAALLILSDGLLILIFVISLIIRHSMNTQQYAIKQGDTRTLDSLQKICGETNFTMQGGNWMVSQNPNSERSQKPEANPRSLFELKEGRVAHR